MRSHCLTVRTARTPPPESGPIARSRLRHQSGTNQPRDRGRGLVELGLRVVAALGDGTRDAVTQVLVEQIQDDRTQGAVDGADLGEDIDAVLVLLDHPGDAAHLALDAPQPLGVVVLLLRIPVAIRHLSPLLNRPPCGGITPDFRLYPNGV